MEKIKKALLDLCLLVNLLYLLVFFVLIVVKFIDINIFINIVFSENSTIIRSIFAIPIIFLWVYSLILWSKNDKRISRFFMLFFLIGIYSPFYYLKNIR